ncbi:MAG: hypothetical protein EOO07_16480 [Chitinophagaceae bacterium]|nr:MAG: hypothetical protein EOO07_16480 [Chitinophagaceae bacterium]
MKKLLCHLTTHKWKWNNRLLPKFRRCTRCGKIQTLNIQKTMLEPKKPTVWEDVDVLT